MGTNETQRVKMSMTKVAQFFSWSAFDSSKSDESLILPQADHMYTPRRNPFIKAANASLSPKELLNESGEC